MSSKAEEDARRSDETCSGLWEVYLREAEQYDHGLVKSWKEDMDVTLVFSGLYSAVLTAFIVESYRDLQPDQTELSTSLLLQISAQLASLSSSDNVPAKLQGDFSPSRSAIACNILWFFSLILALVCALLATFVQQWTRHFLHRTTILRTPAARARLISFLYYGLKNFKMHTIVEVIPSILHLSLFSFFGGLVAFLHPINPAIQWLAIGSLICIASVYAFLTMMPVFNLSSPYQTPLSPIIWRTWQSFWWSAENLLNLRSRLRLFRNKDAEDILPTRSQRQYNLTYAMVTASHQNRHHRESRLMTWTMRSLHNDMEFIPFIEALPDVIYGLHGVIHDENLHLLKPILETSDPDIDVISRTFALHSHSQDFWMKPEETDRALAAIPGLLWAVAYVLNERPQCFDLRKTGRSSWFSIEQLTLLERYRDHLDSTWMTPTINLIKANTAMCRELDLSRRDPLEVAKTMADNNATLSQSKEQGRILVQHLLEIADVLPQDSGTLNAPTFYALKGHQYAKNLDLLPIYEKLMHRITDVHEATLSEEPSPSTQEEGKDDETESIGDETGFALLQLCQAVHVPQLCKYLLKRIAVKETYPMLQLWAPSYEREQVDDVPGYVPFLHSVLERGSWSESCVKVLKDILSCFDKQPSKQAVTVSTLRLNPRWWTDLEPLWLDVLDQLTELDEDTIRLDQRSLSIMVKATVVKKFRLSKDAPLGSQYIIPDFLTRLHPSMANNPTQPSWNVSAALLTLAVEALTALDKTTEPEMIQDLENTLKFLFNEDLSGAPYAVDNTITEQLALQTWRCTHLLKTHPSSELSSLLKIVWTVWEDGSSSDDYRDQLKGRIQTMPEAASHIVKAADTVISICSALTQTAVPDDDEDGDTSSLDQGEGSLEEYIERVRAIRELWVPGTSSIPER